MAPTTGFEPVTTSSEVVSYPYFGETLLMLCLRCGQASSGKFCSTRCATQQYVVSRRRKLKKMAVEYKGGSCQGCGYRNCVQALQFHHVNPEHKDFSFSRAGSKSWERLQVELDKCVLVCANCHAEIHSGIRAVPNNQPTMDTDLLLGGLERSPFQSVTRFRHKPPKRCLGCGCEVYRNSVHCGKCESHRRVGLRSKINWPSLDSIKMMLSSRSYESVARELGVSSNAIRKRLKTRAPIRGGN